MESQLLLVMIRTSVCVCVCVSLGMHGWAGWRKRKGDQGIWSPSVIRVIQMDTEIAHHEDVTIWTVNQKLKQWWDKDPEVGGWLQQGEWWVYKMMTEIQQGRLGYQKEKEFWNLQKEARTERQKKAVLLKCAKLPLYAWNERVNEWANVCINRLVQVFDFSEEDI